MNSSPLIPGDEVISAGPRPISPSQRIEAIDVLRGLVLLGILFINMPVFGLPHWASENPKVASDFGALDWWAWFGSEVLWHGKMRAIFSMLFGAGVVLMTRHAEASGPEGRANAADIYYRRLLWLIVFGIVDGYLLAWPGDILYWYGLIGLLLFPLRNLKARTLIIAGVALIVVGIGIGAMKHQRQKHELQEVVAIRAERNVGREITKEQRKTLEKWEDHVKDRFPPPEAIEKEVKARRGGYVSVVESVAPITMGWNSSPIYRDFDILPMMLLGLGFARAGVITGRRSTRFYALLAAVCLPVGYFVGVLEPLAFSRSGFDPEFIMPWASGGVWGRPAQRLLLALGYLGVVMLAARVAVLALPLRAIAAAGRMPLTNYVGQSVICLFIFSGVGLGKFGDLSRSQLMLLTVVIWGSQVIFGVLWTRRYAYGPMEWAWRWLAYRRKPPWRLE